jgi:hypothetical protein
MEGINWSVVIADVIWFLVLAGWVVLIMAGLEADKPLSGGLPGQVDIHEAHAELKWSKMDRLGVIMGWIVFGLASASLPVILWWIFNVHDKAPS